MDDIDTLDDPRPANIDKAHVERRVAEWIERLNAFLADVKRWAEARGYEADASHSITMHEELMEKFDVAPVEQPTLFMHGRNGHLILKPKALWVIGANGRLDLYTPRDAYIVVDKAEKFEKPQWMLYDPSRRGREGTPFDQLALDAII